MSARRAFTLVELLIAVVLTAILATSVALAASRGYDAYEATQQSNDVESSVRQALDRAARELLSSGVSVISPANIDDQFGTSDVVFQQAAGQAAGNVVWGNPLRLLFEYDTGELDNGQDDDTDGLVDEGRLVFVRDDGLASEQRVVLCHSVREFGEGETDDDEDENGNGIVDEAGFNVHRDGTVLTLRLTLEQSGDSNSVIRTLETSIRLRN
jgi:prepilin-type N-terminal cleavage/methylation domain-containing protein